MTFNIYKSKTYQEFREFRGESRSALNKRNPGAKEIKDWERREEIFQDVKSQLVFLAANLRRAACRGSASQKIEVDLDYVYDVGAGQDFVCMLTGEELEFTRGGQYWLGKWCNPYSCTIDRIDSNKGYIKDNIQLITWKANCIKQHLPNSELIEFCKDVAHYNR